MRYLVKFERYNFGFTPALKQTADVVFETDISPDDEDAIELFEDEAWLAVWEQNPHWLNPEGPFKDSKGWSSVLFADGAKYIKIG